ncbi:MAG: tRNA threonylcarbamoyladenosine dehydratase [Clostridia bacterium]|nr:tRNA threonylcarbamoyladenosine dehydratase [Clostridia bacterium]
MIHAFSRSELLLGAEALKKLKKARVAVFGVGGVGGYTVEALARSGVGTLHLIDNDDVSLTNINRQIIALHSTVGKMKVDVLKERVLDINPDCRVYTYNTFFMPETAAEFDFTQYDYVVDAIDTVAGKIQLAVSAREAGVPIICAMGAGNKLDPNRFEVTELEKTTVCPLARVMRREMKKRGITGVKVVYSREEPITPKGEVETDGVHESRRQTPGSLPFVPAAAGLILASAVVYDLIGIKL